ncbi:glycosyltransferase [Amphritea sp.]|uniref:glycosyltransferase family 2 protein n=1 Tax=Amphritea sp. TaxID=1872502 RepID=UPI0025C066A6|nr:glycosyltransferase [Amphritea sp.]
MDHMYISIVSHGNDDDIIDNLNLKEINSLSNVTVIIRDNLSSQRLSKYCSSNNFEYNSSDLCLGFGSNNNINFKVSRDLGMSDNDCFVVCNPDLNISAKMINDLFSRISGQSSQIYSINLFFDDEFSIMEYSIRKFPTFLSFFNVLKGKSFTDPYDKADLEDGSIVDWAAGSFLVFDAGLYEKLGGFDEKYFMYFEDVDICYRAKRVFFQDVVYLRDIIATHQGGYKNRNIFSKHFRWYFSSLFRFLFKSTFGIMK